MEKQIISGGVGVAIRLTGLKTPFPYIPEIEGKTIKYIDIANGQYDPDNHSLYSTYYPSIDVSLCRKGTNDIFINRMNADAFNPESNLGNRMYIGQQIDTQQSFLNCPADEIGNYVFMCFFWQDSEIRQEHKTTIVKENPNSVIIRGPKSFFPDNRIIAGKRFTAVYGSQSITDSEGNENLFCGNDEDYYINLVRGSNVFLKNVPLNLLKRYNNWTNYYEFDGVEIDQTNSWIDIPQNDIDSGYYIGNCVVLNFEYKE